MDIRLVDQQATLAARTRRCLLSESFSFFPSFLGSGSSTSRLEIMRPAEHIAVKLKHHRLKPGGVSDVIGRKCSAETQRTQRRGESADAQSISMNSLNPVDYAR